MQRRTPFSVCGGNGIGLVETKKWFCICVGEREGVAERESELVGISGMGLRFKDDFSYRRVEVEVEVEGVR